MPNDYNKLKKKKKNQTKTNVLCIRNGRTLSKKKKKVGKQKEEKDKKVGCWHFCYTSTTGAIMPIFSPFGGGSFLRA